MFDEPSKDDGQKDGKYFLSPAAKLYMLNIPDERKNEVISGLINEAIFAREMMFVNPVQKLVGIIPESTYAFEYAQARMMVDEAFQSAGSSAELLRLDDHSEDVDHILDQIK